MTHALLRFERAGSPEANWAATVRSMDLSWEITGAKSGLSFSQVQVSKLPFCSKRLGLSGYARIKAGSVHPPYGRVCPAPRQNLGFNDLKVIEVAQLLAAHARGGRMRVLISAKHMTCRRRWKRFRYQTRPDSGSQLRRGDQIFNTFSQRAWASRRAALGFLLRSNIA